MVLRIFTLLLLLFYIVVNGEKFGETRTLSGYKDPPGHGSTRTLIINSSDDEEDDSRMKRSIPIPKNQDNQDTPADANLPNVKLNFLDDGHKQLMVHWAGEDSNVIICLAVDPAPLLATTPISPSSVYISYDYGDTYENKTDLFKLRNGSYSTVVKFYNHPKYRTHFIFTDVQNNLLFVTTNYGRNIARIDLTFTPNEVSFHEYQPHVFVVLDKTDDKNKLWITEDLGQSWRLLQEYVKSFYWIMDKYSQQQLIVQRMEPSNLTTIFYANVVTPAKSRSFNIYATEVKDIFIKGDYIFYTMKSRKDSLNLYVSYKLGKQLLCIFDTDLDLREYFIADVTGNRALIAVGHKSTQSNLYVSENLGGSNGIVKFTLSLENVLCYFPNSTWKDSWLHHVTEDAFTDVYKVEGLSGIYIASIIISQPQFNNLGPQNLASRITFDHGSTWRPIKPPQMDKEGQLTPCQVSQNCSLHLSQRFNHLYPETRTISILSSKSAPGVIVATGVIGKSLKGHYGVYVSTDAGITWRQSLRDLYIFNMGDHGGILTAVKYLKLRGETRDILYSTDEGESWLRKSFHYEDLRLYGLMTEPGENTTTFTMFGSLPQKHKWIIIKLDLLSAFKTNCSEDDYKHWSPSTTNEHERFVPCILGQQRTYKRRIPHANCYNGLNFDHPLTMEQCECDKFDYECDFGFIRSGNPWHCIRNKTEDDPYKIPVPCKVGDSYNRTKGYRKISGDVCVNGMDKQYMPDIIPCPQYVINNMLIYAKREKIIRMNLVNNVQEILQIPDLKNVIAIDFDLKNNCVYWADIVSDTIGRLCEDGRSPPEILVSSDLVSVEGMALDWVSNNLYFVDGLRGKIELIRTNIHHSGRMRRTIIAHDQTKKPRGIAVHPKAGYLFWSDWDSQNPSVNRANLDGTNLIKIADKSKVEWPNGITIDYIAERVYWVDAREDYIGSTDLHGNAFKKVDLASEFVSHPFAVAVFKDDLYWDDWKRNSIFVANKDHGGAVGTVIGNISGLMDLKVIAHGVQEGSNPCFNSTCPYICVGSPNPPNYVCLCPDGMIEGKGKCLCPGGSEPLANMTCTKSSGTCSSDHFECGNGVCVPQLWSCDGEDDCGDNSDENHCHTQTCAPNHFVCGDKKCLPHYWRCDYDNDCEDGSDEKDCPKQNCTSEQFTCQSGRCISLRWKCDGEDDCRDGSDERNCYNSEPVTCKEDEFKCEGGGVKCIPYSWKCDGESDCRDLSDENNCSTNKCNSFQFSCGNSTSGNIKCIYSTWVCDGDKDCENGSDEKNCTYSTSSTIIPLPTKNPFQPINGSSCLDYMFTCANKKCIPVWWKCDGANDCEDESDEIGCHPQLTTPQPNPTTDMWNSHVCSQNQFQCASGECIAMSWVCDKSQDCMDGEDEAHCDDSSSCDHDIQFRCHTDGSCVALDSVCNGHPDCPDGSDETFCTTSHNLPGPATPSCSIGYFPCDINRCFPLSSRCNGEVDCEDGSDEPGNCSKTGRVYQVLQMGVDERGINDTSLLLYWWIPIPEKNKLFFLPSISSTLDNKWTNKTWTEHTDYLFSDLKPFTKYNMTIYVKINGTDIAYPPAKYYIANTGEGIPTPPWNVSVKQMNGSNVLVSWNKPTQPNGIIQNYEICWQPPVIKMRLSDNSTAHLLTADFESDTKYSFHVIAYNRVHASVRSEVKSIIFDGQSDLDTIKSLQLVESTNNSITLSWTYNRPFDGFIIEVDVQYPYPTMSAHITTTNNISITNLAPGIGLTFRIKAFKTTFVGPVTSIMASTIGNPLPKVFIYQAVVLKNIGTSVKLTWDRPKDSRKINWIYGIYYGVSEEEILNGPHLNTTDLSITVQNLYACEKYIFAIGIVGPVGVGPLSLNTTVTTFMNLKAPPKKVSVQQAPPDNSKLQMLVKWSPSCPNIDMPIGYRIIITDNIKNINNSVVLQSTTAQELSRSFDISHGGAYDISVSTDVAGAIPSKPITFKAPPIFPPTGFQVFPESNGSFVVYWTEVPNAAALGSFNYELLVSEGNELNEDTALRFEITKPPFIFTNKTSKAYTFAIQLKTSNGYRSMLSEVHSSISNTTAAWTSNNNLATILTPVVTVLIILLCVLIIYVIKYRRLQTSFTRFTNSHYDTRSEAATFDDNVLEEDDSPQIRGFADDVPLVIA